MLKDFKTRTCNACGWVYFGVSREYAEDEVKRFNEYFNKLSKKDQEDFYGGHCSSIASYEGCWCGNRYDNFRESKPDDCPNGVTMNPIIYEPPTKTKIKKTIKKVNKNFKNTLSKLAKSEK